MYYKKEIITTKLRDILSTDIKGTTFNGIEDGAKELGVDTKISMVHKEGFCSIYTFNLKGRVYLLYNSSQKRLISY